MLAQLNANLARETARAGDSSPQPARRWYPGSSTEGAESSDSSLASAPEYQPSTRLRLQYAEAKAIRERIMKEMMSLEEQRMQRMKEGGNSGGVFKLGFGSSNSAEDESIIRKELNKVDPSAVVFSESWANKRVWSVFVVLFVPLILFAESNTTELPVWPLGYNSIFLPPSYPKLRTQRIGIVYL